MDSNLNFTNEELEVIKEALWNYKLIVSKSSSKFHFRYLDSASEKLKDKHELIVNLLKKIDYGNV